MAGLLALGSSSATAFPVQGNQWHDGADSPITAAGTAPARRADNTPLRFPDSLFASPRKGETQPCQVHIYPALGGAVNTLQNLETSGLAQKSKILINNNNMLQNDEKTEFLKMLLALPLHLRGCSGNGYQ